MRGADYIVQTLEKLGIDTAFVLTGGCIVHFIDALGSSSSTTYTPLLHEQSCAMAADAYSRVTGKLGVAATTSGPGATNLVTGVCCSYYDSIPVLLITGQVHSSQLKRNNPTRQLGFQETDVVSIFQSITKYSTQINKPQDLVYELDKAIHIALEGRQGPVLLDITEDVLYGNVCLNEVAFIPTEESLAPKIDFDYIISLLNSSSYPVIVLGRGVLEVPESLILAVCNGLGIPVLLTWGAFDLINSLDQYFVGGFGVTSQRGGNFTIQNSDLILGIGTRFDSHEIGTDVSKFAPHAKRIIVDIDSGELETLKSKGFRIDYEINTSALSFFKEFEDYMSNLKAPAFKNQKWFDSISNWNNRYPICHDKHRYQNNKVNPYVLLEHLSSVLTKQAIVVTDCGSNLIWTMQSLQKAKFKKLFSAFNHSPMGYSLPAAIGATYGLNNEEYVICISGDGGFQINIQELAIIHKQNLPILIIVLNNHSHGIIQGTQDNWLNGRHYASSVGGKLPDSNISAISSAYNITSYDIYTIQEFDGIMGNTDRSKLPLLLNIHLETGCQIEPKLLYGNSIENSHPLLDEEELKSNLLHNY